MQKGNLKCDATNCVHNIDYKCKAGAIHVSGLGAVAVEGTSCTSFVDRDEEDYSELTKFIRLSTNLSDEEIESFHVLMWIFTQGIASLVASGTVKFEDNQIKDLLSYEFQALMLLKENPNNKWVIKNNNFKEEQNEKK